MTRADLKASTRKELAEMAKRHQVAGWHAMRKEQLVDALSRLIRRNKSKNAPTAGANGNTNGVREMRRATLPRNNRNATNGANSPGTLNPAASSERRPKRLTAFAPPQAESGSTSHRDQLVAEVVDPHWIHVCWQLSQRILDRAEASLGVEWHQAVPVIRVFDVTDGDAATAGTKSWVSDVEIQMQTDRWFVPVAEPSRSYKLQIGYLAPSGKFFSMSRSRKIVMPRPSGYSSRQADAFADQSNGNDRDGFSNGPNSAEIAEAVRTQQRLHERTYASRFRSEATNTAAVDNVEFHMEADISIRGLAHPLSKLTLLGEHVDIAGDGSFAIQFALAEGRQVIPAVMLTPDGNEQRTIVLAIERNTKHLEPQSLEEML